MGNGRGAGKLAAIDAPSIQEVLYAVAEDIKQPLLLIARQAELARQHESVSIATLTEMQQSADASLRLLDSYLFGVDLLQTELALALEPVALSGVLYDAAQALQPLARQRNCTVELRLAGRYGQVMAHRIGLRALVESLLYTFVQEAPALAGESSRVILSAQKRTGGRIAVGVHSAGIQQASSRSRLGGGMAAAQAYPGAFASLGGGALLAEHIAAAIGSPLQASKRQGSWGFVAEFAVSEQLSFV